MRHLVYFLGMISFATTSLLTFAADPEINIHGPILTWDGNPTTSIRVTWVEDRHLLVNERVRGSQLWRTGQAGFGYGDDDDKTVLEDMRGKFARVYLRYEFDVDKVQPSDKAELHIRYDDGFIAYLNGQEFARKEIRRGRGKRAANIGSHEASGSQYRRIRIKQWPSLVREGKNILAIEGHNAKVLSSDFTLDPYLTLNGREVIKRHANWVYLAGRDPGSHWTARDYYPFENNRQESIRTKSTGKGSRDLVYYRALRPNASGSWSKASGTHRPFGDTGNIVRTVPIDGLDPATDYEFAIARPPNGSNVPLRFRTAPKERPKEFSFVAGGDMSASKVARRMNRVAGQLDPMFALLGGDLAYANGKNLKAWHDWLDNWRQQAVTKDGRLVPMVIAIGNHELGSELDEDRAAELGVPKNSQFFFSLFSLPKQQTNYLLRFGDYLALVVLDSDHSQPVGAQTGWLESTLQVTEKYPFRFVCYHRPAFGTAKDEKVAERAIRREWVPLFEKYEPTAVFENDHHTLKRTHRIRNGQIDPSGVLYLGDGAWGVKTRDIKDRKQKWYLANAAKENHLWHVRIRKSSQLGDVIDCQALDEKGNVLDAVEFQPQGAVTTN